MPLELTPDEILEVYNMGESSILVCSSTTLGVTFQVVHFQGVLMIQLVLAGGGGGQQTVFISF
jgi:hypothetical protein